MSRMRIHRKKSDDRSAALLERSGALSRQTEFVAAARKGLEADSRPLDSDIRPFFESRFGHDFSQVQVHAGGEAAASARALDAAAYTVGQDVVFGADQYAPETLAGRLLLAHELAHVVQYEQAGKGSDEQVALSESSDAAEAEASNAAVAVATGGIAHVSAPPAAAVSRGGVLDWLEETAGTVTNAVGVGSGTALGLGDAALYGMLASATGATTTSATAATPLAYSPIGHLASKLPGAGHLAGQTAHASSALNTINNVGSGIGVGLGALSFGGALHRGDKSGMWQAGADTAASGISFLGPLGRAFSTGYAGGSLIAQHTEADEWLGDRMFDAFGPAPDWMLDLF